MNIGRYEVINELGQGGMAIVYLAQDPFIKRQVAVKVLPRKFTHDPQFRVRFEREAQVIAALEHANIVPIYDFGEHEDQPFIVMRYLPGGTLTERLSAGALSIPEIATLFQNIASALDYAHKKGVIHRDIKPGNILFGPEGRAHLSDFGIAKIQEASAAVTGTGNLIGTPSYMSPEQAKGEKDIDGRADIYSLGVVLFQCLSGELPFTADTPMGVAIAHIQNPVPSLMDRRPDLPSGFDSIIHTAMDKEPIGRFQSAAELALAINHQAMLLQTGTADGYASPPRTLSVESPLRDKGQRLTPDGKPVSARAGVEAVSPDPPQIRTEPKRSGSWQVTALLAVLILLLGVAGGMIAGLIPNPFASLPATEAVEVIPTKAPTDVPSQPATEPAAPPVQAPTDVPTAVPTVAPSETPFVLLPEIKDAKGISMVLVPAGTFLMGGNDRDAEPDERGVHSVNLDDYYIDKYEATNAAYQACVTAGKCKPPIQTDSFTRSKYYGIPAYEEYPVVYVDWNMAKEFCEWRDARLPTEAEWEKAARGSEDQRYFPWGNSEISCQIANYSGPGGCYNGTTMVGSYDGGASPYGVYDMAGNVWEWVADWYSETYYNVSPSRNPTGPDSGLARVLRGGSWNRQEFDVRVSNRNRYNPTYFNFDIGFRCASDVPR